MQMVVDPTNAPSDFAERARVVLNQFDFRPDEMGTVLAQWAKDPESPNDPGGPLWMFTKAIGGKDFYTAVAFPLAAMETSAVQAWTVAAVRYALREL